MLGQVGSALEGCGPVQNDLTVTVITDICHWIHLDREKWENTCSIVWIRYT